MSQHSTPIPLLCIGRHRDLAIKMAAGLSPNFYYPAIVDFESYSPQTVRALLATLNPEPAGVIIGGGFSLEQQQEIKQVVDEHNAAPGKYQLKYFSVPIGTIERDGPAGLMKWVKDALGEGFGVSWEV